MPAVSEEGRTPLVFISYAKEDAAAALRLSESLKIAGFRTWLDQDQLLAGQYWPEEIRQAIKSCNFFVALLSTRSLSKRGFVQRELKQALDIVQELPEFEKFLIPVRLDDCLVRNETLERIQRVDLFPHWEVGIGQLLASLKGGAVAVGGSTAEPASQSTSLLPIAVVRELLQLDRISRKNYVRRLWVGGILLIAALTITFFVTAWLDLDGKDTEWEGPVAGIVSPLMFAATYFLISGTSRWRISYAARREIVRTNLAVDYYFRAEYPMIHRLILGRWYWRVALFGIHCISALFLIFALIFLAIAVSSGTRGDWTGIVIFVVVFSGPILIIAFGARLLSKAWGRVQRLAGILE